MGIAGSAGCFEQKDGVLGYLECFACVSGRG